jgi:hypothetical protein
MSEKAEGWKRVKVTIELPCFGGKEDVDFSVVSKSEEVKSEFIQESEKEKV